MYIYVCAEKQGALSSLYVIEKVILDSGRPQVIVVRGQDFFFSVLFVCSYFVTLFVPKMPCKKAGEVKKSWRP